MKSRVAAAIVAVVLIFVSVSFADSNALSWDTFSDTWVATDQLGRTLPTAEQAGGPRPGKIVAMFYFLSLDNARSRVWDNSKLLAQNPQHPAYGPVHADHWWGEPWFGYYRSNDEAVVRKHMQMLTDAGVDLLVFDNTNGPTYPKDRLVVCKVLEEMKSHGQRVPKIACFTGNGAWSTAYHEFYEKHQFEDLWFKWLGKPLMLTHREGKTLDKSIEDFFTIRESWAWTTGGWFKDGRDMWPWLDNYPQNAGWHENPKALEEACVSVAQHPTGTIGRSYHAGKEPTADHAEPGRGLFFDEQIGRALQIDPQVLFITQWNEWTAMRFLAEGPGTFAGHPMSKGDSFFVDEYLPEYSRDIEPVKGGFEDNYYYQMISLVRRFKGVRPIEPVSSKSITLDGKFTDWKSVKPEYRDDIGDPVHRDALGWGNIRYTNKTGRNDLVAAKVCYDSASVYFYVRSADTISPRTDPNWMLLFINVKDRPGPAWLGYQFIVNHSTPGDSNTTVEMNLDGTYHWGNAVPITYAVKGNELAMRIPRSVLGITQLPAAIDFKWADNIQQTGEAGDFTLNGDVAPNDRYNYRAILGQ